MFIKKMTFGATFAAIGNLCFFKWKMFVVT